MLAIQCLLACNCILIYQKYYLLSQIFTSLLIFCTDPKTSYEYNVLLMFIIYSVMSNTFLFFNAPKIIARKHLKTNSDSVLWLILLYIRFYLIYIRFFYNPLLQIIFHLHIYSWSMTQHIFLYYYVFSVYEEYFIFVWHFKIDFMSRSEEIYGCT